MKTQIMLILSIFFVIEISCTPEKVQDPPLIVKNKLIGTWIEKYPEKFDGISDTLVFGEDSIVRKYIIFKDCKYGVQNDTILFQKLGRLWRFHFQYIDTNEIIIYNFVDRLITSEIKDINYIKIY